METKRLFIATFAHMENLHELQEKLKPIFSGKFVKPNNLHVTFKFLGEVSSKDEKRLIDQLSHLEYKKEQQIIFKKVRIFHKKFIVFKSSNKTLYKIHDEIEELLPPNFGSNHHFKPHITIMKVKEVKDELYKEKLKKLNFEATVHLRVCLVRSFLIDGDVRYEIEKEF